MQLGLESKNKTIAAAVLGVIAVVAFAYVAMPYFTGSAAPASNAQAAAPAAEPRMHSRSPAKGGKNARIESLDPTLRLDLLAASEQTLYQGNGRNIFVSQAEDVPIPKPIAPGSPDAPKSDDPKTYVLPPIPPAPPIPLKFYGFASAPGEPKKVFLKLGDDVFVAGEGEIVDRRYKVIRISPMSVEMQDVVNSSPPQNIPLTQG